MGYEHTKLKLPQRSEELTNKNRNCKGRKPVRRAITSMHQEYMTLLTAWSPGDLSLLQSNTNVLLGYGYTWSHLLCSLVSKEAPYLEYQPRTKFGGTGWGSCIWCCSLRNGQLDLSNRTRNQSQLKNKHKNIKRKSWSDTYAAWSLGSPAPPVCVAAGASTAALHNSRDREEKENHQCEKQLSTHFQMHRFLLWMFSEQQNKQTPSRRTALHRCNCRSGCKHRGFRVLLWVTRGGSCKGSWQGDKNVHSQGCFSILSRASRSYKPLILKNKQKNAVWQYSNKTRVTLQLLMTPKNPNYFVQIKLIWENYGSLGSLNYRTNFLPQLRNSFTFTNISWKWNIMAISTRVLIPQQKESLITRMSSTYWSATEYMHYLCTMQYLFFFSNANDQFTHNFSS